MSEEIKKEMQAEELSLDELEGVAGGQITFKPLLNYMKEHEITMYSLIKAGVVSPTESTQIRADHNFRLSFVNRLCEYLGCQVGDVIAYIPDDVEDNSIDELLADL
ncbi:MAG: helix-turn-helix transcriptional regulator [Lachnospiraceae bacterium]|nr:helix-turn-helix transcriptional regulator [Lachnospiraceae bacterium]MBR1853227.1 helix-turn-helix transcriptional regulator [Lachnospiraceae bacterium]